MSGASHRRRLPGSMLERGMTGCAGDSRIDQPYAYWARLGVARLATQFDGALIWRTLPVGDANPGRHRSPDRVADGVCGARRGAAPRGSTRADHRARRCVAAAAVPAAVAGRKARRTRERADPDARRPCSRAWCASTRRRASPGTATAGRSGAARRRRTQAPRVLCAGRRDTWVRGGSVSPRARAPGCRI